jgi:hypothetical protein
MKTQNTLENKAKFFAQYFGQHVLYFSSDFLRKIDNLTLDSIENDDFFRTNFNDKYWKFINVPGMWELNGYGDPVYLNIGYPWRNDFTNNPPYVPLRNNHEQIPVPSDRHPLDDSDSGVDCLRYQR